MGRSRPIISRRDFTAFGASALALSACAPQLAGPAAGELRFSILSSGAEADLKALWAPVLADMQAATAMTVTPVFAASYAPLVEAMRRKAVDVGWFSNQAGLEAVRRADGEVFARATGVAGADGRHTLLVVKAGGDLTLERVLKCDRTLSFGMEPGSSEPALAPTAYLFAPKGIDPEACFRSVRVVATGSEGLAGVAGGQIDVAAVGEQALAQARARAAPEARAVKVVWSSPLLPEDPIVWRKDLDAAVKEKVRQFLLTYGQGDTPAALRQNANLVRLGVGAFAPADDDHLLPARETEAARLWLAAARSGNALEAAAAKRTFDAVRAEREALENRIAAPAGAQ